MFLVGSNNGFDLFFNTIKQEYFVYKDNKFFADGFFRFSEVKCYLD